MKSLQLPQADRLNSIGRTEKPIGAVRRGWKPRKIHVQRPTPSAKHVQPNSLAQRTHLVIIAGLRKKQETFNTKTLIFERNLRHLNRESLFFYLKQSESFPRNRITF